MLSIVTICILVGSALAESYGSASYPQPGYPQPGYPQPGYAPNYGSNYGNSYLLKEIRALGYNVSELEDKDEALDAKILALNEINQNNSLFVDKVVNELEEEWIETITNQNAEIAVLELEAVRLLELVDDIAVLNKTIQKLAELGPSIEAEIAGLQKLIEFLKNSDDSQEEALEKVLKDLKDQLKSVEELEEKALEAEEQIVKFRETIEDVNEVLNSEIAVDVNFELTGEDSVQTKRVAVDFGDRLPLLHWAVSKLSFTNNVKSYSVYNANVYNAAYGSSYASNPYTSSGSYDSTKDYSVPLNFPATVAYDIDAKYNSQTGDVTVRLSDFSTGGWKVAEVGVTVTVSYKDNSILVNSGAKYY